MIAVIRKNDMNTLQSPVVNVTIASQNERSEREILLEQLREWRNQDKHVHMVISRIEKRLAQLNEVMPIG